MRGLGQELLGLLYLRNVYCATLGCIPQPSRPLQYLFVALVMQACGLPAGRQPAPTVMPEHGLLI